MAVKKAAQTSERPTSRTKTAATSSGSGKSARKKAAAGSSAAQASAVRKVSAKRTAVKKPAGRKYSPAASALVAKELHEMHEGHLHIGKSNQVVTNPKQAIAIALAEARRAGKKVPPNPSSK